MSRRVGLQHTNNARSRDTYNNLSSLLGHNAAETFALRTRVHNVFLKVHLQHGTPRSLPAQTCEASNIDK